MTLTEELRQKLDQLADPAIRESGQRFFKEETLMRGIKTQTVIAIGKEFLPGLRGLQKKEIYALCEDLWMSGYLEETFIACQWSYSCRKQFTKDDMEVFEKWISRYITNWASCDTFCNHTVGELVMKYPELLSRLKQWAKSPNLWMRRASAVSLIIPARDGLFLNDIFEIAGLLLTDREDMVQKGYGWMLKAATKHHQAEVFSFVMKNKEKMPRTSLRYAIEKMPDELKKQAMARS